MIALCSVISQVTDIIAGSFSVLIIENMGPTGLRATQLALLVAGVECAAFI
jgi:hypothetical protein